MAAYYNEIDPFAAQWLRNLIAAGLIAPGEVDERDLRDVRPDDLGGFTQCHFFAGIGVWSYALRLAGWPDDRPVWTGSCPCQPFSDAGRGLGIADERHLWPFFHYLIQKQRPEIVFGEQVASKDGLGWLDLVQADMEGTGYAFGAADLCAAGVGAPHIRQRLFFVGVADTASGGSRAGLRNSGSPEQRGSFVTDDCGATCRLVDDDERPRLEGQRRGHSAEIGQRQGSLRPIAETGEFSGVANNQLQQRSDGASYRNDPERRDEEPTTVAGFRSDMRAGPVNGFWENADWLFCRDGKWRPVESGTFPLVNGASARVGRLRAYGNAIVAPLAAQFIAAAMEYLP